MLIPVSQFILSLLLPLDIFIFVLCLCLYFCFANKFLMGNFFFYLAAFDYNILTLLEILTFVLFVIT